MKVKARLDINIYVDCPHCDNFINLLDERDTDGISLNDEGKLLSQALPDGHWSIEHKKFKVSEVVCSECKGEFSVKELEW